MLCCALLIHMNVTSIIPCMFLPCADVYDFSFAHKCTTQPPSLDHNPLTTTNQTLDSLLDHLPHSPTPLLTLFPICLLNAELHQMPSSHPLPALLLSCMIPALPHPYLLRPTSGFSGRSSIPQFTQPSSSHLGLVT